MSELRYIFGYGSLIFQPELADRVVEHVPARALGYRRVFNKISRTRGCERAESLAPELAVPARFRRGTRNLALVLGVVPDPDAVIDGFITGYRSDDWDALLALTDAREGYVAGRDPLQNAYLRETWTVERRDRPTEALKAVTYPTNPDPACAWIAGDLTLDERARVIAAATPRRRDTAVSGAYYLEGVRDGLRGAGVVDPLLEALARAVAAQSTALAACVCPAHDPA